MVKRNTKVPHGLSEAGKKPLNMALLMSLANRKLLHNVGAPNEAFPIYTRALSTIDSLKFKSSGDKRVLFLGDKRTYGAMAMFMKLTDKFGKFVEDREMLRNDILAAIKSFNSSTEYYDSIVISPCYIRDQVFKQLNRESAVGRMTFKPIEKEKIARQFIRSLFDKLKPGGSMLVYEPADFLYPPHLNEDPGEKMVIKELFNKDNIEASRISKA
jgi:hypothetical protein